MQFIYHIDSSKDILIAKDELYNYLFRVRRLKSDQIYSFRNLKDDFIYRYKLTSIGKKEATFYLVDSYLSPNKSNSNLHLAWAICDLKTIEKTLPSLNELGLARLSFIYSDFSQKNFKINYDRIEKILINSSMQCGRSDMMIIEEFNSLEEFLGQYPNSHMLNFSNRYLNNSLDIKTLIVGSEGGFSPREIELFEENKIIGLKNNLILRSETATISAVAILSSF